MYFNLKKKEKIILPFVKLKAIKSLTTLLQMVLMAIQVEYKIFFVNNTWHTAP